MTRFPRANNHQQRQTLTPSSDRRLTGRGVGEFAGDIGQGRAFGCSQSGGQQSRPRDIAWDRSAKAAIITIRVETVRRPTTLIPATRSPHWGHSISTIYGFEETFCLGRGRRRGLARWHKGDVMHDTRLAVVRFVVGIFESVGEQDTVLTGKRRKIDEAVAVCSKIDGIGCNLDGGGEREKKDGCYLHGVGVEKAFEVARLSRL
jgi:hypothetical protein